LRPALDAGRPPMEDVLINITPQETRVAVLMAGAVQELHIERTASRGLVGNIYQGKVARVLPGMQSAFIDIGLERAAFLHVADIWESRNDGRNGNGDKPPPIERQLHEGDARLVQVIKDPIGTKGARLSTQISLAGRMLVYLPQDPHIGVSQKIESEADRAHLREQLARLVPPDEKGGFIIRTSAEGASDEELRADIEYLRLRWSQIRAASRQVPAPSLLYQELSLAQRVLRDVVNEQTAQIQVDSRENFVSLQAFATQYVPKVLSKIAHYGGERPLFDLYQIDDEIERALGRRVDLKSGGYLIIDQTEAMTTVDVNTGGFVGTRNFDDTIFKTNLEAAQAIARQLRLRNLGGIIVVDFIDMEQRKSRQQLMAALELELRRDRSPSKVLEINAFGLVIITRKRVRQSLARTLCQPCPYCTGSGLIKNVATVCSEIYDEVRKLGPDLDGPRLLLRVNPEVARALAGEEGMLLRELTALLGKEIRVQADPLLHHEQFDVVTR
jgi:ribonuclease G